LRPEGEGAYEAQKKEATRPLFLEIPIRKKGGTSPGKEKTPGEKGSWGPGKKKGAG